MNILNGNKSYDFGRGILAAPTPTRIALIVASVLASLLFANIAVAGEEGFKLRNGNSGMYLAVLGAVKQNGGNIVQGADVGQPDIVWVFERQEGKAFKIRNGNSGRYLAVVGNSKARGGNIIQWRDVGQPDLIWEREKVEGKGCFKFRNRNSGMYLAVTGNSKAQGANVIQWGDVGQPDLVWCREKVGSSQSNPAAAPSPSTNHKADSDSYKLRNGNSGMYLAVPGAAKQNGGNMVQWADVGQPDIVWVFERQKDKAFKIRNGNSGLYLAVAGNSKAVLLKSAEAMNRTTQRCHGSNSHRARRSRGPSPIRRPGGVR